MSKETFRVSDISRVRNRRLRWKLLDLEHLPVLTHLSDKADARPGAPLLQGTLGQQGRGEVVCCLERTEPGLPEHGGEIPWRQIAQGLHRRQAGFARLHVQGRAVPGEQ